MSGSVTLEGVRDSALAASPARTSGAVAAGSGVCHLPSPMALEHGGALRAGILAFDSVGTTAPGAPVVLVLGGISAGRRVADAGRGGARGWWEDLVGRGRALDPHRLRILGVDYLGGTGASSPATGCPFDTADQAAAIRALLDELRVARLDAVVGASYGGQVGQRLAARYPSRVGRLVSLCAPFVPHPLATAWRSIQRQVVALGVAHGCAREATALARQWAMTTYRTAAELGERFGALRDRDGRYPVEHWLEARGRAFAETVDGEQFANLSASIDLHDQDPALISVPTTVLGFAEDQLVPIDDLRAAAARLPDGVFVQRQSRFGHDGFLKEPDLVDAALRDALGAVGEGRR